jgi:AraC-like DNA-binding protein
LTNEYRVEKAKPLLAVEHYSVTEAASACGFSDSNYFSAVFHRLTGVTPKEFGRKKFSAQVMTMDYSPRKVSKSHLISSGFS